MMSLPWPRVWAGVAVHNVFTTYEGHKSSVRSLHLNYNLRQWLPTLPRCRERSCRFQRNPLWTKQCQMWSFAWRNGVWCCWHISGLYFIPTFISGTSELNWPSGTESLIREAILSGKNQPRWYSAACDLQFWFEQPLTLTNLKVLHEGWKNLNKTARNHSLNSPGSRYWLWIMG